MDVLLGVHGGYDVTNVKRFEDHQTLTVGFTGEYSCVIHEILPRQIVIVFVLGVSYDSAGL